MSAFKIVAKPQEIESRLAAFDVTKEDLLRVVHAAVAAKADAVLNDPVNAAGQLSYIYGTRALRDILCAKGWAINRSGNIESAYHAGKGIKIVFQNADSACELFRDPKAISGKGPAATRAVELGQHLLFPQFEEEARQRAEQLSQEEKAAIWYFCVCIDGDNVSAELSWPRAIDDKQFNGFNERIFVLPHNEWHAAQISDDEPTEQDFEIKVVKKS